jgi:hypothetical protein
MPHPPHPNPQVSLLRQGTFSESQRAWTEITKAGTFHYGCSQQAVIAILGPPDFRAPDGLALCYKTGGGPLWFDFQNGALIQREIVRPARWRGTDQELADWWANEKDTDHWYEH